MLSNVNIKLNHEATCRIPLARVTLVGGLLKGVNPLIIEAIAQEVRKTNPNANAILAETRMTQSQLFQQYQLIAQADCVELILLPFLHLARESILGISCTDQVNQTILIHRKNQPDEELHNASHVLQRLAMMVFNLVNERILLVSEIENGLHHISYKILWIHIIEFTRLLNAQVIATTHSLEMITVFAKNTEKFEDFYGCVGYYVEIANKAKTDELIGIKYAPETILYAIAREQGIRGEPI